MLKLSCCLWACCGLLFAFWGQMAMAQPVLTPFLGSEVIAQQRQTTPFYPLNLTPLKLVNGELQAETVLRLQGELLQITYQVPAVASLPEVAAFFDQQLTALGGERLFDCQGRDCGSSNDWANEVFKIKTLYGRDRDQHYMVHTVLQAQQPVYFVVYLTRRGNGRQYVHLEQLRSLQHKPVQQNAVQELNDALLKQQRIIIPNLRFDRQDSLLLEDDSASLKVLINIIELNLNQNFYLVGHLNEPGQSVEQLQARSALRAKRLMAALVAEGIEPSRLAAYGVGPLLPIIDQEARIELIRVNK